MSKPKKVCQNMRKKSKLEIVSLNLREYVLMLESVSKPHKVCQHVRKIV